MSHHVNFSSLTPDQESAFVVYEEKMSQSQSKAFTIAGVAAAAFFVIAMGIYLGVSPKKDNVHKSFNMSNLTKKQKGTAAPAPTPAAAPAPSGAAPAAAPAEAAAPTEGAAAPAAAPAAPAPAEAPPAAAPK